MPGRSITSTICAPSRTLALASSTVTPGQLPTRAAAPVKRLKNVDLPVLGMPSRAIFLIPGSYGDLDMARVAAPDDDVGGADTHLQRTGEKAPAYDLDALAGLQTQRHEPPAKVLGGVDRDDTAALSR